MKFLFSVRPRSTSESKNKKPSVISVIKNSFRSSSNSSNNNNISGATNVLLNAYQSISCSNSNNNNSGSSVETQVANVGNCAGGGSASQVTQQQPSAPTSPGAVMDPFSLDYLYALNHSVDCPQHPNYHQQFHHNHHHNHHHHLHHHSFHGHKSARPRSRSGSSSAVASSFGGVGSGGGGVGPTMARMFDMFRGRSNSIAASTVTSEGGCNCNSVSRL